MTRKEILDKVAETVSETLSIELGELDESTSFDEYDADSLDRLEVLVALEDALGVEIDDDAASELKTVGDLVDAIEREL
jgi:acyl carrier protein